MSATESGFAPTPRPSGVEAEAPSVGGGERTQEDLDAFGAVDVDDRYDDCEYDAQEDAYYEALAREQLNDVGGVQYWTPQGLRRKLSPQVEDAAVKHLFTHFVVEYDEDGPYLREEILQEALAHAFRTVTPRLVSGHPIVHARHAVRRTRTRGRAHRPASRRCARAGPGREDDPDPDPRLPSAGLLHGLRRAA